MTVFFGILCVGGFAGFWGYCYFGFYVDVDGGL
jgi:hypothetical protein